MSIAALLAADPNTALFKPAQASASASASEPSLHDDFAALAGEVQARHKARQAHDASLYPKPEAAIARTPAEALADLAARRERYIDDLRSMDWSYPMSDDYSVFCAGSDEYKRLRDEQRAIDPGRVIWDRETRAKGVQA